MGLCRLVVLTQRLLADSVSSMQLLLLLQGKGSAAEHLAARSPCCVAGGAWCERTDLCSSLKATYLNATLDQEGPAQLSWYSKWAVHAGKLAACRHHRQSHL
jgi:hypothetical protein